MRKLREIRLRRGLSQADLSAITGVAEFTISEIESGKRANPRPSTLRKLAQALKVEVADLYGEVDSPLGQAPPSPQQPNFNGLLEEEQRTAWEAAVNEARRLRETRWAQMQRALKAWRESKDRGEPYAARREHLDEMGALLEEAYSAYEALGGAYIEAAVTQGGSEASVPSYLREETQAANDFYVEMFGLVRSAGLGIRTGDDAAAAKQATAEQAAAEDVQSETRALRVEEPEAA